MIYITIRSELKRLLTFLKNLFKKEKNMNFNAWYAGLSQRLKDEGYTESAKTIDETIGEDGTSGVAKVIADYYRDNPIDMGDINFPLTIKFGEKREGEQDFELSFNFSDNPILNSIITKVLLQVLLSAYLAGSYSK